MLFLEEGKPALINMYLALWTKGPSQLENAITLYKFFPVIYGANLFTRELFINHVHTFSKYFKERKRAKY